ncbi:MAG: hypothetical protein CMH34_13015 [Microbacterium sp.]|nr:hypothetical protein [Microbacterium sp.]|tara:strand:- start:1333 stop:1638 length:306 start_codon:yes stop_codon:yes gene_type:complete
MTNTNVLVEGEPAGLLLEALTSLMENSEEVDGMVRFEGPLAGDSGAALVHALGRVTAELHADDMRSFLPGATPNTRTEEQRAAEAFFILAKRVDEALTGQA